MILKFALSGSVNSQWDGSRDDVLDLPLVLDLHQSQDQVTNECNSQPGGDDVDTVAK